MVKIKWSNNAIQDLLDISEYIARDSLKYAKKTTQSIFTSAKILKGNPKSGRIVPELSNSNIRELVRGNYRIIYLVKTDDSIDILTVHHSARELHNLD